MEAREAMGDPGMVLGWGCWDAGSAYIPWKPSQLMENQENLGSGILSVNLRRSLGPQESGSPQRRALRWECGGQAGAGPVCLYDCCCPHQVRPTGSWWLPCPVLPAGSVGTKWEGQGGACAAWPTLRVPCSRRSQHSQSAEARPCPACTPAGSSVGAGGSGVGSPRSRTPSQHPGHSIMLLSKAATSLLASRDLFRFAS